MDEHLRIPQRQQTDSAHGSHESASEGADRPTSGLSHFPTGAKALLSFVGAVATPPSIAVALAYFFAVKRQQTLVNYFGLDLSLLEYSVQDYLMLSTDTLFLAMLFLALAGLGALRVHAAVARLLANHTFNRQLRLAALGMMCLGAMLLVTGLVAVFGPLPFYLPFLFRPLSLGVGIILFAYSDWMHRKLRGGPSLESPDAWLQSVSLVLVALVAFLSLFWATSELAQALGREQATAFYQRLYERPAAIVYATRRLHLDAPGVTESALQGGGGFRFRYTGLRMLVLSGGKYFLVNEGWKIADGVVMVLPDEDNIRIQFNAGS